MDLLVYTSERANQSRDRHCGVYGGFCFIVDYTKSSAGFVCPTFSFALQFLQIFQCIYAELLSHAFLINTPWIFSVINT